MKTIEMLIPADFEKQSSLDDFVAKAVLASAEVERLRFLLSDIRFAIRLIKVIRYLKKISPVKIEVLENCGISDNVKLLKAFKLIGVQHIGKMSNMNRLPVDQKLVGLFTPEELQSMPQNFLVIKKHKLDDKIISEAILRITYKCNEKCNFCFIFQNQKDAPIELVKRVVANLKEYDVQQLSFSGGEPTLVKELPEIVRLAKESGIELISLQTNGVLLAKKSKVEELVKEGLDMIFLAFHSHIAEVSEKITGVKNTHQKTLDCFTHFMQTEIDLVISSVINRVSIPHLYEFAKFITEQSDKYKKKPFVNFAISAPIGDYLHKYAENTPTVEELRIPLQKAVSHLIDNGIVVAGFDSPCGPPLCVLGDLIKEFEDLPPVDKNQLDDFYKAEVCRLCRVNEQCYGLRKVYLGSEVEKQLLPYE